MVLGCISVSVGTAYRFSVEQRITGTPICQPVNGESELASDDPRKTSSLLVALAFRIG